MSSGIIVKAEMLKELKNFLKKNKKADILSLYLHYIEEYFKVQPALFLGTKTVYKSKEAAIEILEHESRIWRETEVKISFEHGAVNERTKKIYICPHSGKIFGDNTSTNPQDAIYEWVSKYSSGKDGKSRVKRFFVSDDPSVIKEHINPEKKSVCKKVFSSNMNGKVYSSKENLLEDFEKNHIKPMSLVEVQNQTKFHIHEDLMKFLQTHIQEERLSEFVEVLSLNKELNEFIKDWIDVDDEEGN